MFLLQTAFEDGITIFVLMAVAALLAALIVYLLMRNRAASCREALEELKARHKRLTEEFNSLKEAPKPSGQAEALRLEIQELKVQLAQARQEALEAEAHAKQSEKEKQEVLARIEARTSELNFERIGVASASEKDDLKKIKGIGPFIEEKLNALKIFTFWQIANFTEEDEEKVNEVIEFFPGRIRRDAWVLQAKGFLGDKDAAEQAALIRLSHRAHEVNFERIGIASPDDKDDLKIIRGVGPFIEKKLNSIRIYTFEQVSRFGKEDIAKVTELIEFFPGRIERDDWIKQARTLAEQKKQKGKGN